VTVKAGKGHDTINEVVYNEETGEFGNNLQYVRTGSPPRTYRVGEGEEFDATYGE